MTSCSGLARKTDEIIFFKKLSLNLLYCQIWLLLLDDRRFGWLHHKIDPKKILFPQLTPKTGRLAQ
jgi:hypothetical protein